MSKAASLEDHASVPQRRSTRALDNPSKQAFFLYLSPRITVFVDPKKKLAAGCFVLAIYSSKVCKLGRYWPGPPPQFSSEKRSPEEIFNGLRDEQDLRRPRPLPKNVLVCRVIHMGRLSDAGMEMVKKKRSAS